MPRRYWCNCYSVHSYVVNPVGEIYMCDSVINKKEYKIGCIEEHGEIEIKEFYKPVHDIKNRLFKELAECLHCKRIPICYGSCNKIYHNTGKRACSITDKDIESLIKLYVRICIEKENENECNI